LAQIAGAGGGQKERNIEEVSKGRGSRKSKGEDGAKDRKISWY